MIQSPTLLPRSLPPLPQLQRLRSRTPFVEPPIRELSAREREVLEHLADGASNKAIARRLSLSPHTVKRHVANIFNKLSVDSRGEAAAHFHRQLGSRA